MKIGIRFYVTLIGCLIVLLTSSCNSANKPKQTISKYGNIDLSLTSAALATIFISSANEIFINDERTPLSDLSRKIKEIVTSKSQHGTIFLKGEEGAKYSSLVSTFSAIRGANINRVNLLVEKDENQPSSDIVEVEISSKLPPLEELKNQYPVQLSPDVLFVILKSGSGLEQEVTLNAKPMNLIELEITLKDVLTIRPENQRAIYIRAATSKLYGDVLQVIKTVERTEANPIGVQLEYLDDNIDKYLLRGRMGGA